jgi:hypothetical protein
MTNNELIDFCHQGKSVPEIATATGLADDQITNHLEHLAKQGWVDPRGTTDPLEPPVAPMVPPLELPVAPHQPSQGLTDGQLWQRVKELHAIRTRQQMCDELGIKHDRLGRMLYAMFRTGELKRKPGGLRPRKKSAKPIAQSMPEPHISLWFSFVTQTQ